MKQRLLYPAAGVLALAVTPLFAQQDDAPTSAPPAEVTEQADGPVSEEDRAAILAFAQEVAEELRAEQAEPAPGDEPAQAAAIVQAALDDVPEATEQPGEEAVVVEDAEGVEMLQPGVVIQRAVIRGNGQAVVVGPGGIRQQAFNEELSGLAELALGAVTDGVTTDSAPSSYRFDAQGPGLLTVAVRAKEGDDMTIEVYSPSGTQLARCDIDFGGNTGAEHLALPIPAEGSYRVVVQPLGNGGPFWMGASFLAFEELESVAPAGPEDAEELTPGQAQEATLQGPETWFTYTAPASGLLMFSTSAEQGDLVIEAYYDGAFDQQVQYSDQDRNGSGANERILMDLVEGQTVYLKVRSFGNGNGMEFNVSSRYIEEEE